MNIDKSGWKLTKLGDLATDINKRIENPSDSAHERFVGLEHFVSGDLKIKSWNSTEGLVSATKEFEAGDILFARRNAYLKRASMVDFSGVCSGDAFVLRENHEKVVPGFISFAVNSEPLWTYANANAAGTMSKRVKWRDLANYEFLLPPKDQQAKLAELLWAADAVIEQRIATQAVQRTMRSSLLKDIFKSRCDSFLVSEICKLSSGKSRPKDLSQEPSGDHIFPVYGGNGIIGYAASKLIDEPTIILGRVGEYCGVVHSSSGPSWVSDNALYIKEWLAPIDPFYVERFLEYCDLNSQQTGGGQPLITQTLVGRNKLPIPNTESETAMNQLKEVEATSADLDEAINVSKNLQKSLINEIFSQPA